MSLIFEAIDKTGRKIHLSAERLFYIRKKHPEVETSEEIENTIKNPDKVTFFSSDEKVQYFIQGYL